MPRILHVINRLAIGGAEVMLLDIIRNSNRAEFDFHILCPFGKAELDERAKSFGIEVHHLADDKSPGRIQLFSDGVKFIRNLKPDLINTHTRFSDLVGLVGGWRAGIQKRIMTVHAAGMYFLDSRPVHEGMIEYYVARFAGNYVAVSDAVAGYIHKNGNIPVEKIVTIHNGIDPQRVSQPSTRSRADIRSLHAIGENKFLVLSIGRLIYEKGFDILVYEFAELLEKIHDVHLLIAGNGPEEQKLKRVARDLHVAENITFSGTFDNLTDLFCSSDCYVQPSRQEGFGLTILEAMSNGLPVIASDVGGIPEIIENETNGLLVSVRKCGDLSSAIERIHSDVALREKLLKTGRETSLDKFHISHTARKYEELYRKILA